jgi:hypothetical protein
MGTVRTILDEIFGLFVDDGSLAVSLLVWCVIVGGARALVHGLPAMASGAALLIGCAAILLVNTGRTAAARARRR